MLAFSGSSIALNTNSGQWSTTFFVKIYSKVEQNFSSLLLPACLIGDQHAWLETNMPDWRSTCLIGDRHTWFKTDMSDQRLTCLIGDLNMPDRRPIRDHDMLHRRPIWKRHAPSETNMLGLRPTCLIRDQNTCLIKDSPETDMPD